jgi:hypothetical protein
MPHLPLRRFRPVLNLGQQRRFDPYAAMRNGFAIRLGLPDQRLETRLQVFSGSKPWLRLARILARDPLPAADQ